MFREGYGPKSFWDVVRRLFGFGDDTGNSVFELMRPDSLVDNSVEKGGEGVERLFVFDNQFEMAPGDVITAWCGRVAG